MSQELDILNAINPFLLQNNTVKVGPGDDCAVLELPQEESYDLLAAVDQVIEDIHFTKETNPFLAGEKLIKRNLSDIAAMGGTPLWALLTVAWKNKSNSYVEEFCKGCANAGQKYNVPIIGGDLASLAKEGVCATLTILGKVAKNKAILRSNAQDGDTIFVTGKIGNSFYSQRHLTFNPRLKEGQFLLDYATSMMDISDGLLMDCQRFCQASKCDFYLSLDDVPIYLDAVKPNAFSDGEDYELLFTAKKSLLDIWPKDLTPITAIGKVVKNNNVKSAPMGRLLDINGNPLNLEYMGYEH
jgi:thiamine-monophosphate kinase